MKIDRVVDFTRGWIIGDFEPSIFQTKDFEVGIHYHLKGLNPAPHIHREVTEYNVLLEGKLICNGEEMYEGEIFTIEKGEVADIDFLTNCKIVCIKVPSIPNDKELI